MSVTETDTYTTPLLPGFELSVGRLFEVADRWRFEQGTTVIPCGSGRENGPLATPS